MHYALTKGLETGNSLIDGEHRKLFLAVNELMDACGKGHGRDTVASTLKFLLDYVELHFSHEEHLQKRNGYPNQMAHRQFHETYKEKLRTIAEELFREGPSIGIVGRLNAHIGVLVSHIRTEDRRLAEFIRQK